MKNKKGFTLIELIATISILLILMVALTGSILKLVNKSIGNYYVTLENSIIQASKKYFNQKNLSTGKVSIDELIELGYSSDVLDENNNKCNYNIEKSFVVKYLDDNNKTKYAVQLTCPDYSSKKITTSEVYKLGYSSEYIPKTYEDNSSTIDGWKPCEDEICNCSGDATSCIAKNGSNTKLAFSYRTVFYHGVSTTFFESLDPSYGGIDNDEVQTNDNEAVRDNLCTFGCTVSGGGTPKMSVLFNTEWSEYDLSNDGLSFMDIFKDFEYYDPKTGLTVNNYEEGFLKRPISQSYEPVKNFVYASCDNKENCNSYTLYAKDGSNPTENNKYYKYTCEPYLNELAAQYNCWTDKTTIYYSPTTSVTGAEEEDVYSSLLERKRKWFYNVNNTITSKKYKIGSSNSFLGEYTNENTIQEIELYKNPSSGSGTFEIKKFVNENGENINYTYENNKISINSDFDEFKLTINYKPSDINHWASLKINNKDYSVPVTDKEDYVDVNFTFYYNKYLKIINN